MYRFSPVMKLIFLFVIMISGMTIQAQMYILNEDFGTTTGTIPPAGWTNTTSAGLSTDLWHFDNPGNRSVGFPVTAPFAIFDSQQYSQSGGPEDVVLETPYFDASVSSYIFLFINHRFSAAPGSQGLVRIFNGSTWLTVATFTGTINNPDTVMLDISAYAGGITNAKIRLEWIGNGDGYWAIDNFRILAPLYLDAGISSVDSPAMPFSAGLLPVEVSLANFGYANLSSCMINWSVNGILQPAFAFNGNITHGAIQKNIPIGTYNFSSGKKASIKVWQSNPNGGSDQNYLNDTTNTKIVSKLCGQYTVGGASPDFVSFTESAWAVNNGGVSCPVVIKVRNGTYIEHIVLRDAPGSSSLNTVTFISENSDSSLVTLHYNAVDPNNDYTLLFDAAHFTEISHIGIKRTNGQAVSFINKAHNIRFTNNLFSGTVTAPELSLDTALSFVGNNFISSPVNVSLPSTSMKASFVFTDNVLSGTNALLKLTKINTALIANNRFNVSSNGSAGVVLLSNELVSFINNKILVDSYTSTCFALDANNESKLLIRNNAIGTPGNWYGYPYGIRLFGGNNISVSKNYIYFTPGDNRGSGIITSNTITNLSIDSNNIFLGHYGIEHAATGSLVRITNNTIHKMRGSGIYATGSIEEIHHNLIYNISEGPAIDIRCSNTILSNNFIQAAGAAVPSGVKALSTAQNLKFFFNTIRIKPQNPDNTSAIECPGNTNFEFKYNIISNEAGGYALRLNTPITTLQSDYNDYYSSGDFYFFNNGQKLADLATWKSTTSLDNNSFGAPPFCTNDTLPQPHQVVLNNAALPYPGITTDVMNFARDASTPDIGAFEFNECVNDAGINAVSFPGNPVTAGNNNVKVILQNQGIAPLVSVDIHWMVNGILQPVFAWNGALIYKANEEVLLGSYNFISGITYSIKAWTVAPNSLTDCDHKNDTIIRNNLIVALCGTYTIGGLNPNFLNFTEAVNALNIAGITCPVIFKVRNGVYNERVWIKQVTGNSQLNTITFESESGDSIAAQLNYNVNDVANNYNLLIDGAVYLSFKKLNMQRSIGQNIVIQGSSHHVQFLNNTLGNVLCTGATYDSAISIINNRFPSTGISFTQPDTLFPAQLEIRGNVFSGLAGSPVWLDKTKGIILENNNVTAKSECIAITGSSDVSVTNNVLNGIQPSNTQYCLRLEGCSHVWVQNNTMNRKGTRNIGIYVKNIKNANVINNTISGLPSQGISINGIVTAANFSGNTIVNGSCGIYGNVNSSDVRISGNRIYKIQGSGMDLSGSSYVVDANRVLKNTQGPGILFKANNSTLSNNYIQVSGSDPAGISIETGAANSKVVFNSINITMPDGSQSKCLEVKAGSNMQFLNNIFANAAGGFPVVISATVSGFQFDYNNYYGLQNRIGKVLQTGYTELSLWQAAIAGDSHSYNKPPFFMNDTVLIPAQSQMNNSGIPVPGLSTDIAAFSRNVTMPDMGAIEIDLCNNDAGAEQFSYPGNPVTPGLQPIKIILRNHGNLPLNSVQINYQINGLLQTPVLFNGLLLPGLEVEQVLTNYVFTTKPLAIKAWTSLPNNVTDCNFFNDTIYKTVVPPLCGIYTVGGTNPDFMTMKEMAEALNTCGISCPVTFRFRNGTYNEHVIMGSVNGNNSTNTITFESESQDSSKVNITYTATNPNNDYTWQMNGMKYITTRFLNISRTGGEKSIVIQNTCHHLTFNNNKLGHIYSPDNSYDSVLVFNKNYFKPGSIDIRRLSSQYPSNITLSKNYLYNNDAGSYVNTFKYAIQLLNTNNVTIDQNDITIQISQRISALYLSGNRHITINKNKISALGGGDHTSCIRSYLDSNLIVTTNQMQINTGTNLHNNEGYNVLVSGGYNAQIKGNKIKCSGNIANHVGIYVSGTNHKVEISNDTISDASSGIVAGIISNSMTINHNNISTIYGYGINLSGTGGGKIFSNKIFELTESTGINIGGSNYDIYNNFIHIKGIGIAKGIALQSLASGNKIMFNSINVLSTDPVNGRGLDAKNMTNQVIKNNIFSNSGGGYVAYLDCAATGSTWDFNNYYTSGPKFAYVNGSFLTGMSQWCTTIGGDANSKNLNPFFAAPTNPLPYQRQINGAGIPVSSIILDIVDVLRNNVAPDIGAKEFMVDFGITRLLNPNNYCIHPANDSITIKMRQFGDIPFTDLKIGYRVNNGTVYVDTIPGYLFNDTVYTFKQHFDFSAQGTYQIKCWILQSYDDNVANDTIKVTRYSYPSPVMNFSPMHACVGQATQFNSLVTIPNPFSVVAQTWYFGDGDSSVLTNPVHFYNTIGIYTVKLKAVSSAGCYNDTSVQVSLTSPPIAAFATNDNCLGIASNFTNGSSILVPDTLLYQWDLGDGNMSQLQHPVHTYSNPGFYDVHLKSSTPVGCSDTTSKQIEIFPLPQLSFTQLNPACFGQSGGWAAVSATQALYPYSYLWNTGSDNDTVFNLIAGTYSATVTDSNACISQGNVVISTPAVLSSAMTASPALCDGISSGWAKVIVTGGVSPYVYLWSNGATLDSTGNLASGSYWVTSTDANSCVRIDSIQIGQLQNPSVGNTVTNVPCFGGNTGQAQAIVSGGNPPYSYLWSTLPVPQQLSLASNLIAGTYYLTVTDSLGCKNSDTAIISQPATLSPDSINTSSVSCNGLNNGNATIMVEGGTPPYQYLWTTIPPATTNTIGNLSPGIYTVTVTDKNMCDTIIAVTITEPAVMTVQAIPVNEACLGSCNGQISINVSGGTPPFTYSWNTVPAQLGSVATDLCPGEYWLTITDDKNCKVTADTVLINTNTFIQAGFQASDTIGFAPKTIQFTFTGSGANNYLWDYGEGAVAGPATTSNVFETGGTYLVTLIANSGSPDYCADTANITIVLKNASTVKIPNAFSPNSDGYNDKFRVESESLATLSMMILDRWGVKIHEESGIDAHWDGLVNGSPAADGVYYYIIHAVGLDGIEFSQQGSVTLVR